MSRECSANSIGKLANISFFLIFFSFFQLFFWLTHDLKFGSFQASFFLLTLCGAFRIWKFCDFACIFFMISFDFTVILFFFFLFFFFFCIQLVLSSVGKFWISDSSEADSISDFRFDFNWIFLIRFKELFAFDFDLALASIRFADKFGFFFSVLAFYFCFLLGAVVSLASFAFVQNETSWVWVLSSELILDFDLNLNFDFDSFDLVLIWFKTSPICYRCV